MSAAASAVVAAAMVMGAVMPLSPRSLTAPPQTPASAPARVRVGVPVAAPVPSAPVPGRGVVAEHASAGPGARPRAFSCGRLAWPGAGRPLRVAASLDGVTASLSGVAVHSLGGDAVRGARLTVGVDGRTVLGAAVQPAPGSLGRPVLPIVTSIAGTSALWWKVHYSPSTPDEPLCVASFGGPHPETAALLGLYAGGAHCCTWLDAWVVRGGALPPGPVRYEPVRYETGNPAVTLGAAGGSAMLVTADDAFAYRFANFADSAMPMRILSLSGDSVVDVTRQHLGLVAAEAPHWWALYSQNRRTDPDAGKGLLPAWVADQCLLGRAGPAWAEVAQLQSSGALQGQTPPNGAAYVSALRTFLTREGYCPA